MTEFSPEYTVGDALNKRITDTEFFLQRGIEDPEEWAREQLSYVEAARAQVFDQLDSASINKLLDLEEFVKQILGEQ